MSPATRKSKRAAAAAAAKQEEPTLLAEAEERASKKQKEDPQTTLSETDHVTTFQTEQKQDLADSTDAEAQPLAPTQSIDAGPDVVALEGDDEAEEHTAEERDGEGEEKEVAVGDGGEQEEGDDEEEVEDTEEVEEDRDRIQLGDTGDDGIGDNDDFEEPGITQEPNETQEDDATSTGQNNGGGLTKIATSSRREDEAFPSQGKIFIGGLTWETTGDTLQNHFGKYGEITDSVVMKNRNTGHPRGFGFVTFADPSVCEKVLKDIHVIDGRTVEAKQTVPREKGLGSIKGPKSKKIFVGGLTTTTTEEELKVYFEKFGKVVEHQIMQDHKTGRSRGFGFVTFDSEEVVDNILLQGRLLELGGKQVEVKIAEPKRAGQDSFAGSSNSSRAFTNRGGSFGGNYAASDPYFARSGSRGGGGRPGGPSYGADAYRYSGGYNGLYGYGGLDDGYAGLGLNYPSFGSGPSYGYNYGGSYGGNARGYGGNGGRYHPYGR